MLSITAVYRSSNRAARAADALRHRMGADRVRQFSPSNGGIDRAAVPTTEGMPPVLREMGAVLGAALGIGTGLALPPLGGALAGSLAAAVLLGSAGGAAGWKILEALEYALSNGLPVDELDIYDDALAKGRSIVMALVDDAHERAEACTVLAAHSPESIDRAHQSWKVGWRDAGRLHYAPPATTPARAQLREPRHHHGEARHA